MCTAIDADTKICISYLVADSGGESCKQFMHDLASRFDSRIQLTTDGHAVYPAAVYEAFPDVDHNALTMLDLVHMVEDEERKLQWRLTACLPAARA